MSSIKTLAIITSLLLTSCTITTQQTKDKEWAISIKPDGTGVNIQPTKPQSTTSPTVTASPVFRPSPITSPSPVIATPAPSLTPKSTLGITVIKPSPVPTKTKSIVQPCPKFTYLPTTISLTLSNGIVNKKVAIPNCKIQAFSIRGISGFKLTVNGDGAGVAIIKGDNLLAQSSQATKGIATLGRMKGERYKVEIVSRLDKFYTITFETKKG